MIVTWKLRVDLRDDLWFREKAEIKRIKKMILEYNKKY